MTCLPEQEGKSENLLQKTNLKILIHKKTADEKHPLRRVKKII